MPLTLKKLVQEKNCARKHVRRAKNFGWPKSLPPPPLPFSPLYLSLPFSLLRFSSLPLKVGTLNTARGFGEAL